MTTKIWIEQLRHPDGRPRYTSRGQLYSTRLGGPDGEVLCQQTISPACSSCRVLLAHGITGPFETWREGVPSACMRGDVEKVAGLTVKEPDRGAIAFARWNAFPSSPVEARTRLDIKPGSGESLQTRTPVGGRTGEQCRRPRNEPATSATMEEWAGWIKGWQALPTTSRSIRRTYRPPSEERLSH